MRIILPATLSIASALMLTACVGGQPGSQHVHNEPEKVVVERTYETNVRPGATTYVAPVANTNTYIDDNGNVIRQQVVTPQAVVVNRPVATTTVVEERRYYKDDYEGREQSQAERQALSREMYNSCPPGAAKNREC